MEILKAKAQDIDEILALQKLAFKQVAETLGNYNIEPLTQSKADIEKEFEKKKASKAKVRWLVKIEYHV